METMQISQTERTCSALFAELKNRYSVDELYEHAQLQKLYQYLQNRCSMAGGNYIHEPTEKVQELLEKFLDYNPKKKPADRNSAS